MSDFWNEDPFGMNARRRLQQSWYDVMQVCLNGHIITSTAKDTPEQMADHCADCGAATVTKCPHCSTDVPGYHHVPGVAYFGPGSPPDFCKKCGKAFPWKDLKPSAIEQRNNPLERVEKILARFHSVARQLRNRHDNRETLDVADEYDVQDLLHALLIVDFQDVRPEEWTPSYAGGSARMDFLLKNEKIVIEAKKTRRGLKDRELGEQLIVDIEKYQHHPDCKTLVCFVYDPEGILGNPQAVKNDLEKKSTATLKVKVFILPAH